MFGGGGNARCEKEAKGYGFDDSLEGRGIGALHLLLDVEDLNEDAVSF